VALLHQLIDGWSLNLQLSLLLILCLGGGAVEANVGPTQIVSEEEKDVRLRSLGSLWSCRHRRKRCRADEPLKLHPVSRLWPQGKLKSLLQNSELRRHAHATALCNQEIQEERKITNKPFVLKVESSKFQPPNQKLDDICVDSAEPCQFFQS